ncbi:hypothetical protein SBA2_600007 [Acidobacteriia bacterium SbA2]|nr:hypothetical protein SBA2_600007 [Acidobacteriia bacterium SbA2]
MRDWAIVSLKQRLTDPLDLQRASGRIHSMTESLNDPMTQWLDGPMTQLISGKAKS